MVPTHPNNDQTVTFGGVNWDGGREGFPNTRFRSFWMRDAGTPSTFAASLTNSPATRGGSRSLILWRFAVQALAKIENRSAYFFWTGNGLRESTVADWQRALRPVFELAEVTGNPHMFRHTFAADLLSRGIPIEDVSVLLGHKSAASRRRTTRTGSRHGAIGLKSAYGTSGRRPSV